VLAVILKDHGVDLMERPGLSHFLAFRHLAQCGFVVLQQVK
jgi:hypothetical protein